MLDNNKTPFQALINADKAYSALTAAQKRLDHKATKEAEKALTAAIKAIDFEELADTVDALMDNQPKRAHACR